MHLTRYMTFQPVRLVLKLRRAATVTPARDARVAPQISTALAPKFNERSSRHPIPACPRQTGEERLRAIATPTSALCRSRRDGDLRGRGDPFSRMQKSPRTQYCCSLDAPAGDSGRLGRARSPAGARCRSTPAPDCAADASGRDVRPTQAGGREGDSNPASDARPDDGSGHLLDRDRAGELGRRDRRSVQVQVLGQGQSE